MNRTQIDKYFKDLSKLYPKKCVVILTGAAAGALYGRVRATMDIDFAATTDDWDAFAKAVAQVSLKTGIEAQFAEDIDRWSSITFLDYREHTYLHAKFGAIQIRLMDPEYWAIGKLARYLDSDVNDLARVFKKTKTSWKRVAKTAGEALRQSPRSTACFLFRRQVESFFKQFGKKTWGVSFDPAEAVRVFHKAARIRS